MEQRQESLRKLTELIKGIEFAMLTTVEPDGRLHSRPMATLEIQGDGNLWFFTKASAPKVHELQNSHEVAVSFADPSDSRYVSISGKGELVRDKEKYKEFWKPQFKAYFPNGLDDQDLALLRVDIERAEYWDSPASKMLQLVGFAKAAITGKPMTPNEMGENKKVDVA